MSSFKKKYIEFTSLKNAMRIIDALSNLSKKLIPIALLILIIITINLMVIYQDKGKYFDPIYISGKGGFDVDGNIGVYGDIDLGSQLIKVNGRHEWVPVLIEIDD